MQHARAGVYVECAQCLAGRPALQTRRMYKALPQLYVPHLKSLHEAYISSTEKRVPVGS